jgi:hypothetical protein
VSLEAVGKEFCQQFLIAVFELEIGLPLAYESF